MLNHNEVVLNGVLKSSCELMNVTIVRLKLNLIRCTPEQQVSFREAIRLLEESREIVSSEIKPNDSSSRPIQTHPQGV